MKSVLITGSSSLLGKALLETAPDDIKLSCTYHLYCPVPAWWLDVTNWNTIEQVFKIVQPDVVIHCSASGDVDFAQENCEASHEVNVKGTVRIVEACKQHGSKLVYLSTNAVFDGERAPYSETDEREPVNKYGEFKVQAENAVVQTPEWLIVRPIFLYGWPYRNSRSNFVTRVIEKLQKGEEVLAVRDTFTQPTYVKDCAVAIWKMLEISNQIIHVAPEEKCPLSVLAKAVAREFGFDEGLVTPVQSSYFKTLAPRPRDTTYDLTKLKSLGISCRGFVDGLRAMKEEK
jgi:dTDP-4-dehydrorhamnose reductase